MAIAMLSPGVYHQTADYSNYVTQDNEFVAGIVGTSKRGPIVATKVTTQEEFVSKFGTPDPTDYGVLCALEALTRASVIYQRVYHEAIKATAGSDSKLSFTAVKGGAEYNGIQIVIKYTSDSNFDITIQDKSNKVLETYTGLNLINDVSDSENKYVAAQINGHSEYVTVSINSNGTLESTTLTLAGGVDGAVQGTAGGSKEVFTITTLYPDSTLNKCIVRFETVDQFGYFGMTLYEPDGSTVIEHFSNLSLNENDERFIEKVISSGSNNISVKFNSENYTDETDISEYNYVITGGGDGTAEVTNDDYITAINKLSNPEVYDIDMLAVPGKSESAITKAATNMCANRDDCMYVIDTPKGLSVDQTLDYSNGTGDYAGDGAANSSYSAIYAPWVKISNPYSGKNQFVPPSGDVIAQHAYSNSISHPWYAMAGMNRGILSRVIDVEWSATKAERDKLYGNRNVVNPIINRNGIGIVVWGDKTTQRASTSLDRVNVRKLVNYITKEAVSRSNQFLFEPNVPNTWIRWEDVIGKFMDGIKNQSGVYDYKVWMTPTDTEIENNQMPGNIAIKPTKNSEFIPISIMLVPYSADLSNYQ